MSGPGRSVSGGRSMTQQSSRPQRARLIRSPRWTRGRTGQIGTNQYSKNSRPSQRPRYQRPVRANSGYPKTKVGYPRQTRPGNTASNGYPKSNANRPNFPRPTGYPRPTSGNTASNGYPKSNANRPGFPRPTGYPRPTSGNTANNGYPKTDANRPGFPRPTGYPRPTSGNGYPTTNNKSFSRPSRFPRFPRPTGGNTANNDYSSGDGRYPRPHDFRAFPSLPLTCRVTSPRFRPAVPVGLQASSRRRPTPVAAEEVPPVRRLAGGRALASRP